MKRRDLKKSIKAWQRELDTAIAALEDKNDPKDDRLVDILHDLYDMIDDVLLGELRHA